MKAQRRPTLVTGLLLAGVLWTAPTLADGVTAPDVPAAMQRAFEARKQATMARLAQDETQQLCTVHAPGPLPEAVARRVVEINRATIQPPTDGNYLGDYRNGEVIAQTGTGLQSNDDPTKPNGGNCYACHELAGSELAYGTIGPSLKHYGKLRGSSAQMLEYTWGKLYNSHAQMPCSNMPRFGHRDILTEQQLRDVMALLFDPASPVNQ